MGFGRVILAGGIPEETSSGWAASFLTELAAGFEKLGLHVTNLQLGRDDGGAVLADHLGLALSSGEPFFLLDGNAKFVCQLPPSIKVPTFSLIVDHPLSHTTVAGLGENASMGVIDRNHAALSGYTPAQVIFLPHGGPGIYPDVVPWEDRRYDVIFPGNIDVDYQQGNQILSSKLNDSFVKIINKSVDMSVESFVDPFISLVKSLGDFGVSFGDLRYDQFSTLLNYVSVLSQSHIREKILNGFGDVRVLVAGFVASSIRERMPPNVTFSGPQTFQQILEKIRMSKIVLNVSHKFTCGSHERIYYAMANHTVAMTQYNQFFGEDFSDGDNIIFYNGVDIDSERIRAMLSSPDLAELSRNALLPYRQKHRWALRASLILQTMNARHFPHEVM